MRPLEHPRWTNSSGGTQLNMKLMFQLLFMKAFTTRVVEVQQIAVCRPNGTEPNAPGAT